jgi:hypothetical protein
VQTRARLDSHLGLSGETFECRADRLDRGVGEERVQVFFSVPEHLDRHLELLFPEQALGVVREELIGGEPVGGLRSFLQAVQTVQDDQEVRGADEEGCLLR